MQKSLLDLSQGEWVMMMARRDRARSQREQLARDRQAQVYAEREADLDRVPYTQIEFVYIVDGRTPGYPHKWDIRRTVRHWTERNVFAG